MKSKKKVFTYMLIGVPAILVIGTLVVGFTLIRLSQIDDYCTNRARQITGTHWTQEVVETVVEIRQQRGNLKNAGKYKITWGFREVLKCYREQKVFFFFLPASVFG